MAEDQLFQFLTKKDEYHSFLEKIYSRGVTFYGDVEQNLKESLVNDYVEMERACLKEDFPVACFHYIKQLETIIGFKVNYDLMSKLNADIKEEINNQWELTSSGKKVFEHDGNNEATIGKIKRGENITLKDIQWREKINIFKHYYPKSLSVTPKTDELAYYKRNHYGHSNPIIKQDKEEEFKGKFSTPFIFMTETRKNLKIYLRALSFPKETSSQKIEKSNRANKEPKQDEEYKSEEITVKKGYGYIKCGLNKDVYFHEKLLKENSINELENKDIYVKISFDSEIPLLDKHGNYKASDVRILAKGV